MENKENKIKAVKLSEDELENVSGGQNSVLVLTEEGEKFRKCDICGNWSQTFYWDGSKNYCSACKELLGL